MLVLAIGGTIALNLLTKDNGPGVPLASESSLTPTFSPSVPAVPVPGETVAVVPSPQSARAVPGVPYAVRLLAPCVVLVDFDGRFWGPPRGFTLLEPTQ